MHMNGLGGTAFMGYMSGIDEASFMTSDIADMF